MPPSYYFDLYRDKDLRPPFVGTWESDEYLRREGRIFDSKTGPADKELIRQGTDRLLRLHHPSGPPDRPHHSGADRAQLMDNTVILFTSDHGEMLSDHGWCRKSLPYNGSAHIPMFISGPERYIGPGPHRRFAGGAAGRDAHPAGAGGRKIPAHLDGRSMLHPLDREYIHGEHTFGFNRWSSQFIVTKTTSSSG